MLPDPHDDGPAADTDGEERSSSTLLAAAVGGDRVALGTLLDRHVPSLRAYIRLRMGPPLRAHEASSDLVQSVCREILEQADRFRHGGEVGFRRWLFKTAHRKIADRAAYYKSVRRAGTSHLDSEAALAGQYRSLCTPSRDASAREVLRRVEAAFDELSDEQREVILGVRMLGLSHRQLGERLHKSEGAVRVLLCRAMARLTELVGDSALGAD
jgi:RNA polymerase sigma-70 factor (ECF subfamily)